MPSLKKLVDASIVFLSDILPKASVSMAWTTDCYVKAFRWSNYCEQLYHSMISSGSLEVFSAALLAAGHSSRNLENASVVLLEEFLRNPNLSDESMLTVFRAMSKVFPAPRFRLLCEAAAQRKVIYCRAASFVQESRDSETITLTKALILKEDLLLDLNPPVLHQKLDPLTKNVGSMELLLTVLSLSSKGQEKPPERQLFGSTVKAMESLVQKWLAGESKGCTIAPLMAAPVKLTRKVCESSKDFAQSWLECIGLLASRLTVVFYSQDHVWSWPQADDDSKDHRYQGLWFSFDQLVYHMQSLLSVADEDAVALRARQYLAGRMQLANCSVWLQVEQRLSIISSN